MPAVNDELLDKAIKHQVYLQRYSGNTVRKIIALLNRVDADLVAKISMIEAGWSLDRLDALLSDIRVINRDVYNQAERELSGDLKALSDYETGFTVQALEAPIPIQISIATPNLNLIYSAAMARPFQGRLLKEWFSDLEESRFKLLRDAMRIGVIEGETVSQLIKRIRGTKALNYADGLLNVSRRVAESIVRTSVNHITNYANERVYQANSEIIKGVRWVSTLDGRTSSVCRARDGQVYPVDSGPRPPAHIGCRSRIVAVTKSWRELGLDIDEVPESTRASMNGQVPAGLNYEQWLRKQPDSFAREVLGESRFRLFKDGGLSLDSFVDNSGHSYTLDQLKLKDSQAFKAAGL